MQHLVEKKIGELEYLFFEIERMRKNTPVDGQVDEYKKLLNNKSDIVHSMNKERLEHYKEIAPLNKKFQVLVFNHLRKLLEE